MLRDNLTYLDICKENPEDLLDEHYVFGVEVIPENPEDDNELVKANNLLNDKIDLFHETYDKECDTEILNPIVFDIQQILDSTKNINLTPFCQFFSVYNSSFDEYLKYTNEQKFIFLKEILVKYCEKRHKVYKSFGYSVVPLQVVSDLYSHKRKGTAQIKKLKKLLEPYNLKELSDKDGIPSDILLSEDDYYFTSDKKGKKLFDSLIESLNLEMKSREKKHDKYPDFVFKHNGEYFIFELKSIKGSGGGQNQSMNELIDFISYSEISRNVHYCSFIDASYANTLFTDNSPKITKQRKSIEDAISRNQCNYFLNTQAAKEFFKDIFND